MAAKGDEGTIIGGERGGTARNRLRVLVYVRWALESGGGRLANGRAREPETRNGAGELRR